MARSYAPLLTAIWTDREFCALPAHAQRVYFIAMSQPNVSYCGVVPFTEKRWASFATDTTPGYINDAVNVLIDAGYVLLDDETEEMWVRSFVKHNRILEQPQLRKSLVRAFAEILSPVIELAVYDALPDDVKAQVGSPVAPCPPPSPEPTRRASGLGQALDLDPDSEPSPSSPQDAEPSRTVVATTKGEEEVGDEATITGACRLLAERRMEALRGTPGEVRVPASWLPKVADELWREHVEQAERLIAAREKADHPPLTAAELADRLVPNRQPAHVERPEEEAQRAQYLDALNGLPDLHAKLTDPEIEATRVESERIIAELKNRKRTA